MSATKALHVLDIEGKKAADLKLDQNLFDGLVNKELIHEAVLMYQTNKRRGTANTKGTSEVRGGGKKPWRQKGTGRARAGTIRSPLWRGGSVTFGPKSKEYYYKLPQKALSKALCCAINDKLNENKIIILEKLELSSHKTSDFGKILKKLKLDFNKERLLVVVDSINENLKMASSNLKKIDIVRAQDVNALNVILAKNILVEKKAFTDMEKRLKR